MSAVFASASKKRAAITTAVIASFGLGLTSIAPPAATAQSASSSSSSSSSSANPISIPRLAVGATATDMHFSWRTTYRGSEIVKLYPAGQTADNPIIIPAKEKDHTVPGRAMHAQATGLRAGAQYTYQVGSDEGGWSEPATFTTQAPGNTWNFLAFSDAQIGVDTKVEEQAAAWRTAVKQATGAYPDANFLLHSGDQVEGWGIPSQQWAAFFSADELTRYPVAMAMGNHETYTKVEGPINFRENANLPNVGSDVDTNYFFERNNALFIVLDANESSPADIEKHKNFVSNTAATHGVGKDWKIVVMHHAPYTHAQHGTKDADVKALREGLAPVFSTAGIDMVMSGHDHMYNRTHLMSGTTPRVPDAVPAAGDVLKPKDGEVLYLTTTTAGGGKYYDFHDRHGNKRKDITDVSQTRGEDFALPEIAVWQQHYTPGYAAVKVSKNDLTVRTHNVGDNSVVDEFTLHRDRPNQGAQPGDSGDSGTPRNGKTVSPNKIIGIAVGLLMGFIGGIALAAPQLREFAAQFGVRF